MRVSMHVYVYMHVLHVHTEVDGAPERRLEEIMEAPRIAPSRNAPLL